MKADVVIINNEPFSCDITDIKYDRERTKVWINAPVVVIKDIEEKAHEIFREIVVSQGYWQVDNYTAEGIIEAIERELKKGLPND